MSNRNLFSIFVSILFVVVAYTTSSALIEVIASATGLICVYLAGRENIWNYPFGFINAGLFAWIFYSVNLYADALLQIIFFGLMAFGWFIWLTKRGGEKVRPTRNINGKEIRYGFLFAIVLSFGWGFYLHTYTDASVPYLDAIVATLSILAQYFLSKKVLQNWFLWIVVDIMSIGLYLYKGLPVIAFTYAVFLIICVASYFQWSRHMSRSRSFTHLPY